MRNKLALLGVCVIGVVLWRAAREDSPDPKLVFDRFWVDHLPRGGDDQFHALIINGERPFGHFATQTPWRGQWEAFHYHVVPRSDGDLDLIFPASNERQRVRFRARKCHEQGFDYCMDVSGSSRGAARYYSKRAWESDDAALRELTATTQP